MADRPQLDPRRIRVGIQTPDGGAKYFEEPLAISISGESTINQLLLSCEIRLTNLAAQDRDYLLTTTSPYNVGVQRVFLPVTVDVGRESTGLRNIYLGQVFASSLSMPPDTTVTLQCKSGFMGTSAVIALAGNGISTAKQLAEQIVIELNRAREKTEQLNLDFKSLVENKPLANNYYVGPAIQALNMLRHAGFDTYIDGNTMVVRDEGAARNKEIPLISAESGMIGIPEITEVGIIVKFLLDIPVRLGDAVKIQSNLYPAANGIYQIYKLKYEAATRDTPFYYIAECRRDYLRYGINS